MNGYQTGRAVHRTIGVVLLLGGAYLVLLGWLFDWPWMAVVLCGAVAGVGWSTVSRHG